MDDGPEITPLLEKAHEGDRAALDAVARVVHDDLQRLARKVLRRGSTPRATLTLDPSALVNETFVRLLQQRARWENRRHFFAIATRIMLRVLADYDRSRRRRKRDGAVVHLSLGALGRRGVAESPQAEIPRVEAALSALEDLEPRAGRIAKLRLLWGLEIEEIAEVLGVSRSTVDRDWHFARAWLRERLS